MKKVAIITGASSGIGKELFLSIPDWIEIDEV